MAGSGSTAVSRFNRSDWVVRLHRWRGVDATGQASSTALHVPPAMRLGGATSVRAGWPSCSIPAASLWTGGSLPAQNRPARPDAPRQPPRMNHSPGHSMFKGASQQPRDRYGCMQNRYQAQLRKPQKPSSRSGSRNWRSRGSRSRPRVANEALVAPGSGRRPAASTRARVRREARVGPKRARRPLADPAPACRPRDAPGIAACSHRPRSAAAAGPAAPGVGS